MAMPKGWRVERRLWLTCGRCGVACYAEIATRQATKQAVAQRLAPENRLCPACVAHDNDQIAAKCVAIRGVGGARGKLCTSCICTTCTAEREISIHLLHQDGFTSCPSCGMIWAWDAGEAPDDGTG